MLFKYLPPARIDVLERLQIRFTQPSALNDPFESAILVDASSHHDIRRMVTGFRRNAEGEGLIPTNEGEEKILEQAIAELEAHVESLLIPSTVGKQMVEFLDCAQGVLSLSRTPDSLLMWSHYTDSHKGFVLGLDENHDFFTMPDGAGRETKPHSVVYTTRRQTAQVGRGDFYTQVLCYKSLEWAYEQEVRIFRAFGRNQGDFAKNERKDVKLFNVPADCIKEIYFGANIENDLVNRILSAAEGHNLGVRVFRGGIPSDRYAVIFEELDPIRRSYSERRYAVLLATGNSDYYSSPTHTLPVMQRGNPVLQQNLGGLQGRAGLYARVGEYHVAKQCSVS